MPEQVFGEGLLPKGENADLMEHVSGNTVGSNFIATSRSASIAEQFAGKNGYVYVIYSKRGVDVNNALGEASPFPEQEEVAIPNGVSSSEIIGAFAKSGGTVKGEFIPNPAYSGPGFDPTTVFGSDER
jgi:hypothetical protein